jgi:guanine nucleotide exchange protein RalF
LDLEAVGDYLSGPEEQNKGVLKHFTDQMDFSGKSFTQGLREFVKEFKLPGEAQKIDRLVQSFSDRYATQNPDLVANADAAYTLAFATIMLATDLHNPSIKPEKKMTFDQFKSNMRGTNNGENFDEAFLKGIYEEIQKKPFEYNFTKESPGYEMSSTALQTDKTFEKLDSLLQSPKQKEVTKVFPELGEVNVSVDKKKGLFSKLTGYEGTLTISDDKGAKATVQIHKPSVFSKYLFGEKPRVIIQPEGQGKGSLDLAAKIAASFSSPVKSIKATYDYEKTDLHKSYEAQKNVQLQKKATEIGTKASSKSAEKESSGRKRGGTVLKKPESSVSL